VADDALVYREDDERFFVSVGRERDDSYIVINSSSKTTDEQRIIPADRPDTPPRLIAPRRDGIEYSAAHLGDRFVILTNDGAENFRVMTAPDRDPGPQHWEELIPGSDTVTIGGFDVFDAHLVLFERVEGETRIRLRRWDDGSFREVEQPERPSTAWAGANLDPASTMLRYGYSSMVTPPSVYLLDTVTGERRLLKSQEVLGDFDAAHYRTERLWVTSEDGVRVPVSLVWRPEPDGLEGVAERPRPCVLYAYGAYEASMEPVFSSARLSLLDRGFVFALAHVRGGGEMGRGWYLDGKLANKQNTFSDVIAVARHLIDEGWSTPDRMVVRGGSAGGLLVGAVINQAPELFAGAVAEVPFVDALNTILDPTQPLTVTEWEEWGNPIEDEEAFATMLAYSPYENVGPLPYPSILATGGLNDTRVNYWEPAKWVQRIRAEGQARGPVLLWTELGAGHGGPSGRYDAWRDEARVLAYVLAVTDPAVAATSGGSSGPSAAPEGADSTGGD
jgi:oligopeptidase B